MDDPHEIAGWPQARQRPSPATGQAPGSYDLEARNGLPLNSEEASLSWHCC